MKNILKSYRFCISPPGAGIDCHRHWESLLLGTIPILLSSTIDSLFDDVPVIILKSIKDFGKINDIYLNEKYKEILEKIKEGNYNFDKFFF